MAELQFAGQSYEARAAQLLAQQCINAFVETTPQVAKTQVPIYGTPRMVAGDAITTDVNKCQHRALNRADDYGPLGLDDAQWTKLQVIFPDGVCDFTKPGVGQQPTIPWLKYQTVWGKVKGNLVLPVAPGRDRGPKQRAMDRLVIFADDFERQPFLKLFHGQNRGILRVICLSRGDRAVGRSRQESNGAHLRADQSLDVAAVVGLLRRPP